MSAKPDAGRKHDLDQIARRAIQKNGFRPDFSADAIRELEKIQSRIQEAK